jgi:Uma2 family endonuclease
MARPLENADRLYTIAEFEQLPEDAAYRTELLRGRIVRSPRPATFHGLLAARVIVRLNEFGETTACGVVVADPGIVLSRNPDTVRGPDVAFFSRERIPENAYDVTFWGLPDLAVEINSPSNRASEIQEKVTEYLDAGVRMVWVVDAPTESVTVYRADGSANILRQHDVLDGEDVLEGFRMVLTGFFSL